MAASVVGPLNSLTDVDTTGESINDVLTFNGSLWTPADIYAALGVMYLKLDQTTHQHVINGAPQFNEGIEIKAGKRLYLDGV